MHLTKFEPGAAHVAQVEVPEECPHEIADLMHQCLSADPEKRPSANDLVAVLSKTRLGRKPS